MENLWKRMHFFPNFPLSKSIWPPCSLPRFVSVVFVPLSSVNSIHTPLSPHQHRCTSMLLSALALPFRSPSRLSVCLTTTSPPVRVQTHRASASTPVCVCCAHLTASDPTELDGPRLRRPVRIGLFLVRRGRKPRSSVVVVGFRHSSSYTAEQTHEKCTHRAFKCGFLR